MYEKLKVLREEKGDKQETTAKLLNITQTTYSRYETGILEIPIQALIDLAIYYDTSIDYIVDLTDVAQPYKRKTRK